MPISNTKVRDATTGPDVVRRDALEEPLDEVLSSIGLGDKKEESARVTVTAPYAYVDVEKEEVKEEEEEEEEVKEEKKM